MAHLKRRLYRRIEERGYLRSLLGRRHYFEQPNHLMLNYLIQGTASDIFKRAVVELHEQGIPTVLYVHDEVVAEVDEGRAEETRCLLEAALAREMVAPAVTVSGLVAEGTVAPRWSDFKEPGWTP